MIHVIEECYILNQIEDNIKRHSETDVLYFIKLKHVDSLEI